MRNKKSKIDLFRRVPQELVRIWEKQSLQGLRQQTMEEVYAEWRSSSITILLIWLFVWMIVACTGAMFVVVCLHILGMVVPDMQDLWLIACASALLLVVLGLLFFFVSSKKFINMNTSLSRYKNAIRDFNLRIETLSVLGEKSFKPASVREYLYVLARDVVVAERRVVANGPATRREDFERAESMLEQARQEFESYFTSVQFFSEFFDPPNRRRLFQVAEEQIATRSFEVN